MNDRSPFIFQRAKGRNPFNKQIECEISAPLPLEALSQTDSVVKLDCLNQPHRLVENEPKVCLRKTWHQICDFCFILHHKRCSIGYIQKKLEVTQDLLGQENLPWGGYFIGLFEVLCLWPVKQRMSSDYSLQFQ